jgi:hypothetical protein
MLTSYELCWNLSLGTWDVSDVSAWNASGENEFGTCLNPIWRAWAFGMRHFKRAFFYALGR